MLLSSAVLSLNEISPTDSWRLDLEVQEKQKREKTENITQFFQEFVPKHFHCLDTLMHSVCCDTDRERN